MRVCSSLELCFWSVAEVFVPLSCAGCPEHCGALLFTLHSSLIIHRHPLSLSPLHFAHNLPFLLVLFSPHAFSILLSHSFLLLSFSTFSFKVFTPSSSSLWCPLGQWRNPQAGSEEEGRAARAGLWLTALCGTGCLAFVPLPRKMEGTQRGGTVGRRREERPVRASFMCRSFGQSLASPFSCRVAQTLLHVLH